MSIARASHDDMRQPAEWMVPSDDRILELLDEEGNLTPQAVEDFGGPSAGHAHDRFPVLVRHGLVTKISRGLYRITDEGEAYLAGELDASTLTPDDAAGDAA